LSSSDTTEATVPATATIPAGQSSVTVNLAAVDDTLVDGTQTVTITASATGFSSGSDTLQVTDNDLANHAPTDVALAPNSVSENLPAGTVVGLLSSVDPDTQDTFAYALVLGPDSVDNAAFRVSGNQLMTAVSLDRELKPAQNIRVRTTDQGGLWFEKSLTITVLDVNETPRLVSPIPNQTAPANRRFRLTLAEATFMDPDFGQSLSYAAAMANGSPMPRWLTFDGRTRTFSGRPLVRDVGQYTVRVTATDSGSPALAASTEFTINVTSYPFPRQNADLPQDVDGSEVVSPLDVLIVINWINAQGSGAVPDSSPDAADDAFSFVDVNGDNSISASDVLVVINYINAMPSTALQDAEGEGIPTFTQRRVATSSQTKNTEPLRLRDSVVDQTFGQAADLFSPADWDELLGTLARG
ncbi:MAG TPA: dockerin type I domain-containing protein, partial [Candidatus Anammoximicrobium sp.]|nr:dockerin type I domain-containing protein [Candidatus Anammoximicrobium sp.]